jgi:DNA-binding NtrC family response regulator
VTAARVLLVDDEPFVLDALGQLLEAEGYEVVRADSLAAASAALRQEGDLDVILSDLRLPDGDALDLLRSAAELRPNLPTVVFSGVGTVPHAVAAMKAGALDFLSKPVDPDALLAVVRRAVAHHGLVEEVRRLRAAVGRPEGQERIVGRSRALQDALALARRAAASDARVLLAGESGTGKELFALEIHRLSRRAKRPFVRVNCAAVAPSLFESELFGHRKGAFTGASEDRTGTFAEAHGGTLALDEVGTLSLEVQAKLLRVLETGEYTVVGDSRSRHADARVVAITNEDLAQRVQAGTFREDLYFRLNVVRIVIPPLRERKEDLAELSAYLLSQIARRDGGAPRHLGPGAGEELLRHDWPGNIRELRNVLERATILSDEAAIRSETIGSILASGLLEPPPPESSPEPRGLGDDLRLRPRTEAYQKEVIREALARSGGRRAECARLLGIDPRNLAYYLRKHGLLEGPE